MSKVGWRHDEDLHEAGGLRAWNGDGVVCLLAWLVLADTNADPSGFVRRMAHLLDLDAERLRQWLFARCVLASVDQPHLQSAAIALAL